MSVFLDCRQSDDLFRSINLIQIYS